MKLARVVVRFAGADRAALDRLRARYFDETHRGLSRASVVRVLVHRALNAADARSAADVIEEPERTLLHHPNLRTLIPRSVSIRTPAMHEPARAGDGAEHAAPVGGEAEITAGASDA